MEEMWKSKIPLKVRNFLWLVYQGRVQTANNLIRKQWKGDKKCKFCEEEETVNHLLFLYLLPHMCGALLEIVCSGGRYRRVCETSITVYCWRGGIKVIKCCFSYLVWCVGPCDWIEMIGCLGIDFYLLHVQWFTNSSSFGILLLSPNLHL
jgi:hypothetical protein